MISAVNPSGTSVRDYNLGVHAIISDGGIDTDLRTASHPLHLAITYQSKYSFLTLDTSNLASYGLYTLGSSYQDTGECSAAFNRASARVSNSGYVNKGGVKSGIILKVDTLTTSFVFTSLTFNNMGYNINHLSLLTSPSYTWGCGENLSG